MMSYDEVLAAGLELCDQRDRYEAVVTRLLGDRAPMRVSGGGTTFLEEVEAIVFDDDDEA